MRGSRRVREGVTCVLRQEMKLLQERESGVNEREVKEGMDVIGEDWSCEKDLMRLVGRILQREITEGKIRKHKVR